MGNHIYLPHPALDKHFEYFKSPAFSVTACEMQGWRASMEDQKLIALGLQDFPGISIFAVFDGHGGSQVSKYCASRFSPFFSKNLALYPDIPAALVATFSQLDKSMLTRDGIEFINRTRERSSTAFEGYPQGGSTACVVVISGDKIYTANLGDSRAILVVNGRPKALTQDHKPQNLQERTRIEHAEGRIQLGRINYGLNLSRAFGDFEYKMDTRLAEHQQLVVSLPQISVEELSQDVQYLLIGCDGVFQRFQGPSLALANFVSNELKYNSGRNTLEKLFNTLLSPTVFQPFGSDNMTAVLVQFGHQQSSTECSMSSST